MPKSELQIIYEHMENKDSVINHKYSIKYVKWLEKMLTLKLTELSNIEKTVKKHMEIMKKFYQEESKKTPT